MVHREEASRAITMIARRRAKIDDRHRSHLPDAPDSDPREVLDYLRKFSGSDIPTWVLQADVCDALTLNNWLWWEDRRRELHFLKAGRQRGLFLSQLGAQVGVGKQGVLDRIDRLEALLRYDRPDEKLTRASRQCERARQHLRSAQLDWIAHHRTELLEIVAALVVAAGEFELDDGEREWLDELRIDARDDAFTPASMVLLGLAASELRTAPRVVSWVGRPGRIHGVLGRSDALRSEFATLGNIKQDIG